MSDTNILDQIKADDLEDIESGGIPEQYAISSEPNLTQINYDLVDTMGRITPQAKGQLESELGSPLKRVGGGSTKEVFGTSDGSKIILVANSETNAATLGQLTNQIDFYRRFSRSPNFNDIVVGAEKFIQNKYGQDRGMIQPNYGISISEYRNKGGKLTAGEIDSFSSKHQQFIAESGFAHGDLGINWDSVRIDPQTKKLKFIDYNGRGNAIASGADTLRYHTHPNSQEELVENDRYIQARDNEAEQLNRDLKSFFGIKEQSKAA